MALYLTTFGIKQTHGVYKKTITVAPYLRRQSANAKSLLWDKSKEVPTTYTPVWCRFTPGVYSAWVCAWIWTIFEWRILGRVAYQSPTEVRFSSTVAYNFVFGHYGSISESFYSQVMVRKMTWAYHAASVGLSNCGRVVHCHYSRGSI